MLEATTEAEEEDESGAVVTWVRVCASEQIDAGLDSSPTDSGGIYRTNEMGTAADGSAHLNVERMRRRGAASGGGEEERRN